MRDGAGYRSDGIQMPLEWDCRAPGAGLILRHQNQDRNHKLKKRIQNMTGLISRLRIRLLIAAAALALHTAQGQTVSGTVVDRLTREPIVGATVIDATRKGTVSDIDGRFAISTAALPATLRISFIGYKPQEAVVTDAGRELAVSLEEEVNDLAEMVAVATARSAGRS